MTVVPPASHSLDEEKIVGGTKTSIIRLRRMEAPAPITDAADGSEGAPPEASVPWYSLELTPHPGCFEGVAQRFHRAPRLSVQLPSSGQTWQLRLTPMLARQLAAEGVSLKSIHDAARRSRQQPGEEVAVGLSLILS